MIVTDSIIPASTPGLKGHKYVAISEEEGSSRIPSDNLGAPGSIQNSTPPNLR